MKKESCCIVVCRSLNALLLLCLCVLVVFKASICFGKHLSPPRLYRNTILVCLHSKTSMISITINIQLFYFPEFLFLTVYSVIYQHELSIQTVSHSRSCVVRMNRIIVVNTLFISILFVENHKYQTFKRQIQAI